jgi:hypothetical protein
MKLDIDAENPLLARDRCNMASLTEQCQFVSTFMYRELIGNPGCIFCKSDRSLGETEEKTNESFCYYFLE